MFFFSVFFTILFLSIIFNFIFHAYFLDQLTPEPGGPALSLGGVIKHRHLPLFFQKYNEETERYGVPAKIRFCFPSEAMNLINDSGSKSPGSAANDFNATSDTISSDLSGIKDPSSSPLTAQYVVRKSLLDIATENMENKKIDNSGDSIAQEIERKESEKIAKEAELRAFQSIELILLEMYFLMKESFARTNSQPCSPISHRINLSDSNSSNSSSSSGAFDTNSYRTNSNSSSNSTFSDIVHGAQNKNAQSHALEHGQTDISASDLRMSDLLCLLKASSRRDIAATFESSIWHSWMAHSDTRV